MASPFPGMDPYLEDPAIWPDFHATFINYWRESIADRLPSNYDARIGERVTSSKFDWRPTELRRLRLERPPATTHSANSAEGP